MPKPYYQDDWVTLYHGDSLDLADLWTCADVLVTDPPYGTQVVTTANGNAGGYGRASRAERRKASQGYGRRQDAAGAGVTNAGRHGCMIANDDGTETRDAALALWGIRPAIVFGSPRMPEPPGDWEDRAVWDKTRPGMNGGAFRYLHESIFARGLVRVDNSTFSILTAWPDQTDHIHAKPHRLMTTLVALCPPGAIADPFAGSGSTLVAAKALGRKAIGVELEERYAEIAARRLAQDVLDFGEAS